MVRLVALASASTTVLTSFASVTADFTLTFTNACAVSIDLYTRLASVYTDNTEALAPGASVVKTIGKGYEGHFRNGTNDAATLVEIATKGDLDLTWFDLGIIPPHLKPGFEFCKSLDECKQNSKSGIGYNTPVQITPMSNTNGENCRQLTCLADGCDDAYNFPQDDIKTHSCPFGTDFVVTFCPADDPTQQEQPTTQETNTPVVDSPVQDIGSMTDSPVVDSPVQDVVLASDYPVGNDAVNGEADIILPEVTQDEIPEATLMPKHCV